MTRTAEDVDMNQYLKEKIHEADPMASMIKKKNREEAIDRGDLGEFSCIYSFSILIYFSLSYL